MNLLLLLAPAAFAQDEAPEEEDEGEDEGEPAPSREYDLTEGEEDEAPLGSALEGIEAEAAAEAAENGGALEELGLPSALQGGGLLLRGSLWFRPLVAATGVQAQDSGGGWAVAVGGMAGHRWWSLADRPMTLAGETRLEVTTPLGAGARGLLATLSTSAGPWWGPIGAQVGPVVRLERMDWSASGVDLPAEWLAGGRATLSADVGRRVQVYGGHEQTWALTGERAWGWEPGWLGGAAVRVGWVQLRGQASLRSADEGDLQIWSAGLGVHLVPQIDDIE